MLFNSSGWWSGFVKVKQKVLLLRTRKDSRQRCARGPFDLCTMVVARMRTMTALERLSLAQGLFNASTGLWPVFHRESFEAVTGPKTDFWLVKTVGLMLATTGAVMSLAARRRSVTPEIKMLGIGIAASVSAIDLIYAGKGRISRIYLLDAAVEAGLITGWCCVGDPKKPRCRS